MMEGERKPEEEDRRRMRPPLLSFLSFFLTAESARLDQSVCMSAINKWHLISIYLSKKKKKITG